MSGITTIGFIAGALTTVAFLPQVLKAWRTRSTGDISIAMWVILMVGIVNWLIYGVLTLDGPVIVSNAMTLALAGSVLFLKIRFG